MPRAPKARPARARAASRSADPVALCEAAKRGEAPPVVVITGQDYFSRDAIIDALRDALVPEGLEGFNATSIPGEELDAGDLVNQAGMLPMGGTHRWILVRRADRVREREVETIAAYAAAPSPTTCVVFVFDSAKGSLLTALKKSSVAMDFKPPRDYQLARWLEAQAARLGVALDTDAARALADLMGENYVGAMSELQTAALCAPRGSGRGSKPRVTRALVERVVGRGHDTNPFHLGDAVLGREPVRAVRIMRDLYDAGGTGYMILGLLESQLRRFIQMRARVDGGEPARNVIQSTSPTLPPDVKNRLTRQLESFDEPRLVEAFRIARETDRAIKSYGSGAELSHMESLVWRICSL